jgi:ribonuclease PH
MWPVLAAYGIGKVDRTPVFDLDRLDDQTHTSSVLQTGKNSVEVPGLQRITNHELLKSLWCHVRLKRLHDAYSSGLYQ